MKGTAMLTNYKLFDKIAYLIAGVDLGFLSRGGGGAQVKLRKKNSPKKLFLGTFWKILTKKSAPPPKKKISICWRQRRLQKNFRVGRPKLDFLKVPKGGPFGSAGGQIPEEETSAPRPLP